MFVIGIAACVVNITTIAVGVHYFLTVDARQMDKHIVSALMTSSFLFLVVYLVAATTDFDNLTSKMPARVLWSGFDLYVSMLHLSVISYVTKCRLLRAKEASA